MNASLIKTFGICLFILFIVPSCKEKDNDGSACGVDNPLENIQWLKDIKTTLEISAKASGAQIMRYRYHNEDVFWIDACYKCPDNLITVCNCSGEVICQFGGIGDLNTCPGFREEATDSTMLWDYVQH
jgi:hypothetical protein